MTEYEYRQHPAISRSELFKIRESPEKFKWAKENPEKPTPALLFGQVFHKMLLQPNDFENEYVIEPKVDKRTKEGRAFYDNFLLENEGKTIIPFEMFNQSCEMVKACLHNDFVKQLLSGEREREFFWTDEMTGEECKCRTDCLSEIGDNLVIVDIKTTENAETETFMRSAVRYGYDFQSAMYSEGVKAITNKEPLFVFVAVEKQPPYAINIMQADELFIRRGRDLFREYIGIYHDCKTTNNWYGYLGRENSINYLSLPAYLAKEVE